MNKWISCFFTTIYLVRFPALWYKLGLIKTPITSHRAVARTQGLCSGSALITNPATNLQTAAPGFVFFLPILNDYVSITRKKRLCERLRQAGKGKQAETQGKVKISNVFHHGNRGHSIVLSKNYINNLVRLLYRVWVCNNAQQSINCK